MKIRVESPLVEKIKARVKLAKARHDANAETRSVEKDRKDFHTHRELASAAAVRLAEKNEPLIIPLPESTESPTA